MATKAEHIKTLKAEHPPLHGVKDGVRYEYSKSEYNATIDQWATSGAATDARREIEENGGASANYALFRTDPTIAGSYPSISDQLDMLFHDITDGKLDKTGSWYKAGKATKDKFTKP